MAKNPPLGLRLDQDVRAALDLAAEADRRTLASLINKILADWVAANPRKKPPTKTEKGKEANV